MRVSIVMAAKNYARFLPMAVRSVQAQTFTDWELVIVDDGSSDDTPAAIKPFLSDQRIHYHRADSLGQSRAKNLSVRLARGEMIAFLDADDAWLPTKLEKQLASLTPDIGVVACRRELIDETVLTVREPAPGVGGEPETVTRDSVFVSNPICFSSAIIHRHVYDRVGGFDLNLDLGVDYDLWLRVASHFRIVMLPEKLVLYRTGHGNLSNRQADRIAIAFTIMQRHRDSVSPAARNEGYGTTMQSLAWMLRAGEPVRAMKWYLKSLAWPGSRRRAAQGLLGLARDSILGRTKPVSPENQTVNS